VCVLISYCYEPIIYITNIDSINSVLVLWQVFSESWDVLRKRLENTPKDVPIYTFCTGGIRCVKVNAWLEKELGFTDTARLGFGIHGYMRYVEEEAARSGVNEKELSHWRGANFIFYQGTPRELPEGGEEEGE